MIAVDTNLLVYAHREDSGFHDRASACFWQGASPARRCTMRASPR